MSGDFKLNSNGKKLSYEQFIAKLSSGEIEKSDSKFWSFIVNVYDTDGNGKIDINKNENGVSEAKSVFEALKNSAGDNGILEENEITNLVKKNIKGIKFGKKEIASILESANQLLTSVSNTVKSVSLSDCENASIEYTPEEVQDISIQTLSDDSKTARKLFDLQNNEQGDVSDFVNGTKETFDTEFAASRVNRYLIREALCADLLAQSKSEDGLSEKEYLEAKINLAVSMLPKLEESSLKSSIVKNILSLGLYKGFGNKTKAEQERIAQEMEIELLKDALRKLKPEELTSFIQTVTAMPDDEYNEKAAKAVENMINMSLQEKIRDNQKPMADSNQVFSKHIPIPGSIEDIEQHNDIYRKMSFEETFEEERGVQYNSENIMDYTEKDAKMQFLLGMHNKRQQIYNILHDATVTVDGNNKFGAPDTRAIKPCENQLESAILRALTNLYGNEPEKLQAGLDKLGFSNLKIIGNKLIFDYGDGNNQNSAFNVKHECSGYELVEIANKLQGMVDANYQAALGDKTIEEYEQEVSLAYQKAYGTNNAQNMAEAFAQSQQKGVQTVKSVVQTGAMVVMIAGQLVPVGGQVASAMIMGGLVTYTVGGVGVSALENYTKEGEVTEEDKKEMLSELATSLALVGSGMGIGKTSEAAFRMLVLKNCPKLLAFASEVGIDATMSLVADYAITGQIDLSGEGIAQLQSILVGILHAKGNLKTYINTHAGDISPKINTPKTDTTKGISDNTVKNSGGNAATSKKLDKISDRFENLKSKNLNEYNVNKYDDNAKQILLDIAKIDSEIADAVLDRYDSIIRLSDIKEAAEIDPLLTKQLLTMSYKSSLLETVKGQKNYVTIFANGNMILGTVNAIKKVPSLQQYLVPEKVHIVIKAAELIHGYGAELLYKNYEDLNLDDKHILLKGLLDERGTQNSLLERELPKELQEMFPCIEPCRIEGKQNPKYIETIKKLYADLYEKDYNFSEEFVKNFNSLIENLNNTSNYSNMTGYITQIFEKINIKISSNEVELVLKEITNKNQFQNLSKSEQKVLIIAQLLKNNNSKGLQEASKNLFKQLGFSTQETSSIKHILSSFDLLEQRKLCKTKEDIEKLDYQIAFELKNGKDFDIASQIYGIEKDSVLFNNLKKVITEIKSNDFALPQTTKSDYLSKAHEETLNINGNTYNVKVVRVSDLPEFNTYIHSIRGTSSTGASNLDYSILLEKYKLFDTASDDNIFCVSYINKENIGVIERDREFECGLMFEVPTEKQFVGAGYDIGSTARNTKQLISGYYCSKTPIQEQVGWGMHEKVEGKYLREIISKNLKEIMNITDDVYIQKWDNIYEKLGDKTLTIENLEKIDMDMANAYKIFLSRSNSAKDFNDDCILRNRKDNDVYNQVWNEFLIGNPTISGIFMDTPDIKSYKPSEYSEFETWIKFAEENNIPIVLLR